MVKFFCAKSRRFVELMTYSNMSYNTHCLFWMQKVQHCRVSPFSPKRGSGCLPADSIYPEDEDTTIHKRQSSRWQEWEICHKKKQPCCSHIFFDLVLSEFSLISYSIWAFHSSFCLFSNVRPKILLFKSTSISFK